MTNKSRSHGPPGGQDLHLKDFVDREHREQSYAWKQKWRDYGAQTKRKNNAVFILSIAVSFLLVFLLYCSAFGAPKAIAEYTGFGAGKLPSNQSTQSNAKATAKVATKPNQSNVKKEEPAKLDVLDQSKLSANAATTSSSLSSGTNSQQSSLSPATPSSVSSQQTQLPSEQTCAASSATSTSSSTTIAASSTTSNESPIIDALKNQIDDLHAKIRSLESKISVTSSQQSSIASSSTTSSSSHHSQLESDLLAKISMLESQIISLQSEPSRELVDKFSSQLETVKAESKRELVERISGLESLVEKIAKTESELEHVKLKQSQKSEMSQVHYKELEDKLSRLEAQLKALNEESIKAVQTPSRISEQLQEQVHALQEKMSRSSDDQQQIQQIYSKISDLEAQIQAQAESVTSSLSSLSNDSEYHYQLSELVSKLTSMEKQLSQLRSSQSLSTSTTSPSSTSASEATSSIGHHTNKKQCGSHFSCKNLDTEDIGYDFASLTHGASIIVAQSSPTYAPNDTSSKSIWGDLFKRVLPQRESAIMVGTHEDAISPELTLGSCWPMNGKKGHLTIALPRPIRIGAVSISHISKFAAVNIGSAPKSFVVYGTMSNNVKMTRILEGSYSVQKDNIRQVFSFHGSSEHASLSSSLDSDSSESSCDCPLSNPVKFVSIYFQDNHGLKNYTCIYNIGIFGVPA